MSNEIIRPGFVRISDISGAFAGYGKIPQNILDFAAARGTWIHEVIYDLINNIAVKDDRYEFGGKSIRGYIESFRRFWAPFEEGDILLQEERLYDDKMLLTGQLDMMVKISGKRTIIDWKCTRDVGAHWILQAAGYGHLSNINEKGIADQVLFVKLDKDGGQPNIARYEDLEYGLFLKAYELYQRFFKDQKCNLETE